MLKDGGRMTGEEMLDHLRMLDKKYHAKSRGVHYEESANYRQMAWACRFVIEEIEKEMNREN
jgi:hypothetical protein